MQSYYDIAEIVTALLAQSSAALEQRNYIMFECIMSIVYALNEWWLWDSNITLYSTLKKVITNDTA